MKYVPVIFPESQKLMSKKGFAKNAQLINDEKGLEDFGPSAYFVNTKWFKKDFDDDQTYMQIDWPECQMLEDLPEFEEHSYPDEYGGYFIETAWLKQLS